MIYLSFLPATRSIAVKRPDFIAEAKKSIEISIFTLVINDTGSRTKGQSEKTDRFVPEIEDCKPKRF